MPCPGSAGTRDTKRDFRDRVMKIELDGSRMANAPCDEYGSNVGIWIDSMAGCVVAITIIQNCEGYNKTIGELRV